MEPPLQEQARAPLPVTPPCSAPTVCPTSRGPPAPQDTELVSSYPTSAHLHRIKPLPSSEKGQEVSCQAGEAVLDRFLLSVNHGSFSSENGALFFRELC